MVIGLLRDMTECILCITVGYSAVCTDNGAGSNVGDGAAAQLDHVPSDTAQQWGARGPHGDRSGDGILGRCNEP